MPKSMHGIMREFQHGKLHSGSSKGPVVKSRAQALAIGLSEQRDGAPKPSRHVMPMGAKFAHLGHFAKAPILNAGHNTITAHPGFTHVAANIAASQGISRGRAGAILAASSRNASKKAHRANPRLNRVKG